MNRLLEWLAGWLFRPGDVLVLLAGLGLLSVVVGIVCAFVALLT